jgi:hypothetical protein
MAILHKKIKSIILCIFFAGLLMVLAMFYVNNINFAGNIIIENNAYEKSFILTSPLGNEKTIAANNVCGYFKSISIELSSKTDTILIKQHFRGKITLLRISNFDNTIVQLAPPDLSIKDKTIATLQYGWKNILGLILLIAFLITISANKRSILHLLRLAQKKISSNYIDKCAIIKNNRLRLSIAVIIAIAMYPILQIFGINLNTIYNLPVWMIWTISSIIFSVPITGLVLVKRIKFNYHSFFAFWAIFLISYFFTAPHLYVGNFGIHGNFQEFLLYPKEYGLLNSIILTDANYIAVLPRIIYSLSYILSPNAGQIFSITSIISLCIYAAIFSCLLSKNMDFLWKDKTIAFVFVVLIALFPMYSMVGGSDYTLAITDIANYGFILLPIMLFSISNVNKKQVLIYSSFSIIFILSKAHLLSLFPVFIFATLYFYKNRNKNGIIFSISSLIALAIQGITCLGGFLRISKNPDEFSTFTVDNFNLIEQLFIAATYYVKSFTYLLFPYLSREGLFYILVLVIAIFILILLIYKAFKLLSKPEHQIIAMWFLSGTLIAISASLFYAVTFPYDLKGNRLSFFNLFNSIDINFIRYTIGINTVLLFSVIPFIIHLLIGYFKTKTKFSVKKLSSLFLLTVLTVGLLNMRSFPVFSGFWNNVNDDLWSKEWKYLTCLLKKEEMYIPILSYPINKQHIISDRLEIYQDIILIDKSNIKLDELVKINSVILLRNPLTDKNPNKLTLYKSGNMLIEITALYPDSDGMRFIYFLNEHSIIADSLVFTDYRNNKIDLSTHIRIIKIKEDEP